MATMQYPARKLPVCKCDVLVAGGGPAGIGAAISAARSGAKTLLIEQYAFLGGMATAGLVPCWAPISDRKRTVVAGLAESIIEETKRQMPHLKPESQEWVPIDAEILKRLLDRRVTEAGASVLFHTQLAGVVAKAGAVSQAVVANKSGLSAVQAKFFIDCTGDGDLAAWTGADFEKGDPKTGEMMPATPCFLLAGVDARKFFAWRDSGENRKPTWDAVARGKKAGDLDIPEHHITAVCYVSPYALGLNFSHLFDVDGTDPAQVSRMEMEGRKLAEKLAAFMRKYCPGCENGVLVTGVLGIRETRRILGEYKLVLEDYLSRRSFPDEILRSSYFLDVHVGKEQQKLRTRSHKWEDEFKPYGPGESHGIPFRCLVPRKLKNVLVAGRCLSADRWLQGACRCMPHCIGMGEAAGTAAAMAVAARHKDIRQLDVQELRKKLRFQGAYLP